MAVRRGIDLGRLAAAAKRPGVDPRINLTFALVEDVAFDEENGMFADVQFLPDVGQRHTCYVSSGYAGSDFGAWPGGLRKGDLVVVGVPMGDPALGCVLITKVWTGTARPPAEFGDAGSMDPSEDPVVVVEPGRTLRVVARDGANVRVEVSGTGQVQLEAKGDATVKISSEKSIDIDAPEITVGGGAKIAREGDLVATTVTIPSFGTPTPCVGQIVSGSSKAKA